MRGGAERGSTGVEYLAVFLVVSVALVAGVALTPGVRQAVVAGEKRAVQCAKAIVLGERCQPGRSGDGGDEPGPVPSGYPTEGPDIGDGEDIDYGLPWPGEWHGGVSNDGPLTGRITVGESMGECRLDENGDPRVRLEVTNDLRLSGELDGKKGGVEAYTGRELTYGISTDPETADEISELGEGGPQPVDPRTIPVGTAITLDESFYEGIELSAAYQALQAQLDYSSEHKVSSGIERIDATHVRISVGDSDVVNETVGLGLGIGDLAAVGVSSMTSSEDGKLAAVDVDISTPQGWAAYQRFLSTGELPRVGTKGTANRTFSDFSEWRSQQELTARFKELGLSWETQDAGGREVTTHHADGTSSFSWVVQPKDDVTIVRSAQTDANGTTTPTGRRFELKDVQATLLRNYLDDVDGGDGPDIGSDRDVTLDFSDEQLLGMRQAALEQLAQTEEELGESGNVFPDDDDVTAEEVADFLEEHPDGDDFLGWRGPHNVIDMATADSADEVFDELTDETTDAEDLVQFLWEFGIDTMDARDGDYPDDFGTITTRRSGC